ncbi:hypothetical protein [Lapillicoccus sp.]|uniref:hypothetical protein n=1 Tax=Lapillicoccus sp. TaxID=1909287 RepID=UPI00398353EB
MRSAAVIGPDPAPGQDASGAVATQHLLADYRAYVAALRINPDAKRLRRRAAERLTDVHPDLWAWLTRPTAARMADLSRSKAWPMICWAWVVGRLPVDLDLMLRQTPGRSLCLVGYSPPRRRRPGRVLLHHLGLGRQLGPSG